MTIYDDAVEAGANASRAVVEAALAEREGQTAEALRQVQQLKVDLALANQKLTDALAANSALRASVVSLNESIAALNKRIEDLQKPEPEPEPTPSVELKFGVGVDKIETLETAAGVPARYHRTYHVLNTTTGIPSSLISAVEADIKAGRTPVVSVKLPGGVADAAGVLDGKYDNIFVAVRNKLDSYGVPIILALHHEPEDDYNIDEFRLMTAHAAELLKGKFVQFWVCYMGYHQLYGTSVWKLENVLIPGVDGYGFDPYLSFGASSTKWTDQVVQYYAKFGAWAKANNVAWGIWETGINEQAITSGHVRAPEWFEYCVSGAKAHGATMWIYFNSETTLDGKHNWKLTTTGANKFAQMVAVMKKYNA